jgi:putative phosphoesterase
MSTSEILVGVISDTHGLLRPQAIDALRGSDLIIHAGDIGNAEVIDRLCSVAPTFAVRGNVDKKNRFAGFPATQHVEVGELMFYVLHEISRLDLDPAAAGFAVVVFGHSHRPSTETRNRVLYLNPGSAGPRRFALPVSLARVIVSGQHVRPEIVTLDL